MAGTTARPPRHTGRRPGASGTRQAIVEAARRQFSELGYDRTSLRQVGLEAGVDPTLVSHFFGTKQQLFVEVVELPFQPGDVIPGLLEGPRDELGLRLARFVLQVLETPGSRARIVGMVRAAAAEPEAARLVREILTDQVLAPLAEGIGSDQAALRAGLAMSQVTGLTLARYVVAVEPLASWPAAQVISAIAPTLQRYLAGPLDPG